MKVTEKQKAINLAKYLIPELKDDFGSDIELNHFLGDEFDFYSEFLKDTI